MTFVPSVHQQRYFDWITQGTGSAVLEAVAGAGKTTTVMKGAALMRGSATFLAFNSKIVKELQERLAASGMSGGDWRVRKEAKTFHSVGLSAMKKAFPDKGWARAGQAADKPDEKKVLKIAESLIIEQDRRDLEGLEPAVAAIVAMAKQRGIGAISRDTPENWSEMVEHFALDDALPEDKEEMVPQVIAMARICLRRSTENLDTIDYDDMIYIPLQRNLRLWQTDWVVIDEAQDTNPTRRALATRLLRPGGRLVAVGDPHQAIYGFTGTDNDSLEQIAQQFGCTRLPLTVTYRCPKAVVREAQRFVSHITAHETAPEGEVLEYHYDDIMANARLGDAVLCRYNKYLVSLVFKFIRAGVAAKIEGRSIGEGLVKLANRWKSIRTLPALSSKLTDYEQRELAKAKAKGDEGKMEEIRDRVDTMLVLIERATEQKIEDVAGLSAMILTLFADTQDDQSSRQVTLCSIHRSKGREWDRVHILGLDEVMPGRCSRDWQMDQEINLQYVAVTRAKKILLKVHGIREEKTLTSLRRD